MSPTKVAVLGGGVGAIVAAFELTRPELEGRFEVTVYQSGWRLGGKGASGRNIDPKHGKRIEEHGLHVWFGFYENAFEVMDAAYRELAAKQIGAGPFQTVWDAFVGCDEIVAFDRQGDEWVQLPGHIDPNPGKPGHGFRAQGLLGDRPYGGGEPAQEVGRRVLEAAARQLLQAVVLGAAEQRLVGRARDRAGPVQAGCPIGWASTTRPSTTQAGKTCCGWLGRTRPRRAGPRRPRPRHAATHGNWSTC